MMFSDDEIKDSNFMRPGDEIISIRKVCLSDKYDKKDYCYNKEPLLSNSGRNDLDVSRSLFRDGFFDSLEQPQARFAWTEEDGNISSLVSEPGFGTMGQTTFGNDLDAALSGEIKEADTSSASFHNRYLQKPTESHLVSSTSTSAVLLTDRARSNPGACKVDKTDPRSRFHFVKYVKRHGRTVKLWECGICSREFQHQYTLMRHLPTHTDERNFHCDACGKSFRQLSTLSQHRAIHSAERPYACEVCNKTFNRVSTLISHRKTHSNEKPYRCHICPKGFHQKGNLRNHLFTHTNERPYRCNICFKGFNQQSNLVCHKNKAHPEDGSAVVPRGRSTPRPPRPAPDPQPDSTRTPVDHCEVSSSVGPYLAMEGSTTSSWTPKSSPTQESGDSWSNDLPWTAMSNGVIVDPIKTYHMGVALATRQTPFALLKPDNSTPVLVKVVDTQLPGGKQMLVPATADDLRVGGKIVVNSDDPLSQEQGTLAASMDSAVQIRVPVVATVVPRIQAGGRLHLAVEEPHHAFHTALSADMEAMSVEPCSSQEPPLPRLQPRREPCLDPRLPPLERQPRPPGASTPLVSYTAGAMSVEPCSSQEPPLPRLQPRREPCLDPRLPPLERQPRPPGASTPLVSYTAGAMSVEPCSSQEPPLPRLQPRREPCLDPRLPPLERQPRPPGASTPLVSYTAGAMSVEPCSSQEPPLPRLQPRREPCLDPRLPPLERQPRPPGASTPLVSYTAGAMSVEPCSSQEPPLPRLQPRREPCLDPRLPPLERQPRPPGASTPLVSYTAGAMSVEPCSSQEPPLPRLQPRREPCLDPRLPPLERQPRPPGASTPLVSYTAGAMSVEPCSSQEPPLPRLQPRREPCLDPRLPPLERQPRPPGGQMACPLPPPSPPLDLIPMDLFEPMECIPLGPQITAVEHVDQPPPSDDSDIFIGEFEESIPISDSE